MTSPLPPPPPPVTVTTTATVVLPPPQVNVVNQPPAQGLGGWAVPIATLVAALIAAVFLTINEALKRRREDRRQWDKEIRDFCVTATLEADKVTDLAESAWMVSVQGEAQTPVANERWSGEIEAARGAVMNVRRASDNLDLIALPATKLAAYSLTTAARVCLYQVERGEESPDEIRNHIGDVERAQKELAAACKSDIRTVRVMETRLGVIPKRVQRWRHDHRLRKWLSTIPESEGGDARHR